MLLKWHHIGTCNKNCQKNGPFDMDFGLFQLISTSQSFNCLSILTITRFMVHIIWIFLTFLHNDFESSWKFQISSFFWFSSLIDSASPSLKVGYVIPSCKDLHFGKHHVVSSNVGMQSIGTSSINYYDIGERSLS